MTDIKNQILRIIQYRGGRELADLSIQYPQAKSEEKEAILAGLHFERWLIETCRLCLDSP